MLQHRQVALLICVVFIAWPPSSTGQTNPPNVPGELGLRLKRPPDQPGPPPRLPDGTISLDGLWIGGPSINDLALALPPGETLPLLPASVKLMEERANHPEAEPSNWCLPMGVPRSTPYPFKFVQDVTGSASTAHLFILHESNIHSYRQIFMDGRTHPADLDPTWFGHSIGSWENKETLVVDTVGYNDKFWFDRKGTPHTEQLHTIERYTRPRADTLAVAVTIDDPGAYSKPFTISYTAKLQWPDNDLLEYICQENNQFGPAGGFSNPYEK